MELKQPFVDAPALAASKLSSLLRQTQQSFPWTVDPLEDWLRSQILLPLIPSAPPLHRNTSLSVLGDGGIALTAEKTLRSKAADSSGEKTDRERSHLRETAVSERPEGFGEHPPPVIVPDNRGLEPLDRKPKCLNRSELGVTKFVIHCL